MAKGARGSSACEFPVSSIVTCLPGEKNMTILSIGEVLWDIFPSGAHLGGAPFNFAASCARLGHHAVFLTAVGDDALGESARQLIAKSDGRCRCSYPIGGR